MARDLAQRFKLRLLEPEVLVAEAIKAAEEWQATHPPGNGAIGNGRQAIHQVMGLPGNMHAKRTRGL